VKTILALLLAATTLFAGDPTSIPLPPPPAQTVLTWDEALTAISRRLHYCPPDQLLLGPEDDYYTSPSQEQINDLMVFFKARREMVPWLEEVFDCDDKATEFKYLATLWSVRQWRGNYPGVLVGKAYVRLNGDYSELMPGSKGEWVTGLHVLNFVVRNDGEIFFIEPQTGCISEVSSFIYEGSIEILKLEY